VDAFLASLSMVTLAEMGDKTQLLSFVLAARFAGRHWAIIAGIFIATIANHFIAAFFGDWIAAQVNATVLRVVLGVAFLAFAAWALIPDKLDEAKDDARAYGAFATALVMFFIAEIGDKTQLATIAMGAKYTSLVAVTLGTTLGMMIANVPAVLIGEKLVQKFPIGKMRFVAAALFAVFGLLVLFDIDLGLVPNTLMESTSG
jgi:putative Ca2+/H+ antiporter (TMEM165/GDT1 family)